MLAELVPDPRQHTARRYPVILAAIARHIATGALEGARDGDRTARTGLGEAVPPHAVSAALTAYRAEGVGSPPPRQQAWCNAPCAAWRSDPQPSGRRSLASAGDTAGARHAAGAPASAPGPVSGPCRILAGQTAPAARSYIPLPAKTSRPRRRLLPASMVAVDGSRKNGLDLSMSVLAPCSLGCSGTARPFPVPAGTSRHGQRPQPAQKGSFSARQGAGVFGRTYRKPGGVPDLPPWHLRWQRPWTARLQPAAPRGVRPIRRSGRSLLTSACCQ
jgi:hypothetical protein